MLGQVLRGRHISANGGFGGLSALKRLPWKAHLFLTRMLSDHPITHNPAPFAALILKTLNTILLRNAMPRSQT